MTDLLGRDFAVGQLVAYGGRAGSHGYMAVGRVSKVAGDKVSVKPVASNSGYNTRWNEADDKAVALRLPGRAVILSVEYTEPPACNCPNRYYHQPDCPRR